VIKPDLLALKQALVDAGVEIYRAREAEIQVAERVRFHIMDSGVRVLLPPPSLTVAFTARSQRSDFPKMTPEDLFEKVRRSVGGAASERGYEEASAKTIDVTDPVDAQKVLDVWHEVTYAKPVEDTTQIVDEVRWALEVEKYVTG